MKIVTGPGRSGTSLAARILIETGADFGLPGNHIPADRNNPGGYFEDIEFVSINAALQIGTSFDNPGLMVEKPGSRIERLRYAVAKLNYVWPPDTRRLEARANQLAGRMSAVARRLDGKFVKCTRLPVCLHVWLPVVRIDRIMFVFRHPEAVARSFREAYGIPVCMGRRLWRIRVERFLSAVMDDRELPVLFVDFDRLCSDAYRDEEMTRIMVFGGAGENRQELHRIADRLVRTTNLPPTDDVALAPRIARLYLTLKTLRAKAASATPVPADAMA